jgi:large subunit ribosomal protein L18
MAVSHRNTVIRLRRKHSIRKNIEGTPERPRLSVFRSSKHIYAQVVDDNAAVGAGKTLVAASTRAKDLQEELKGLKKVDAAKKVGETIAKLCIAAGVEKVVFDRNGFLYHGRIRALADGAREAGLKF